MSCRFNDRAVNKKLNQIKPNNTPAHVRGIVFAKKPNLRQNFTLLVRESYSILD